MKTLKTANIHSTDTDTTFKYNNIDGIVQDCGNSIVNALELLQSRTKPSISMLAIWYIVTNQNMDKKRLSVHVYR